MSHSTQTRFNATNDNGYITIGLSGPLAINRDRAIRSFARHITGGVSIVITALSVGGVVIDHGIHIASSDSKEEVGFAQRFKCVCAAPIGLRDNAHAKPLTLKNSPNHRHTEARVVDVGVTCHDDNVATVPAKRIHFGTRHGEPRCRSKALRPIFSVCKDVCRLFVHGSCGFCSLSSSGTSRSAPQCLQCCASIA